MSRRVWRVVVVASAVFGGVVVREILPSSAVDESFWREFWSGPPVAGLFALIGAGIAFEAARRSSIAVRRGAERQEWWLRAEWAMNLARSPERLDRLIGLNALEVLLDAATRMEGDIVAAVMRAVTGDEIVDIDGADAHNETYRRKVCAWLTKDG